MNQFEDLDSELFRPLNIEESARVIGGKLTYTGTLSGTYSGGKPDGTADVTVKGGDS